MRLLSLLVVLSCAVPVAAAADDSPCARLADRSRNTVVVFEPPSSFAVCRGGEEQRDVLAGRRVYFELLTRAQTSMFEYRLRGRHAEPSPSGLQTWQSRASDLAAALEDLADSSATVAELPAPATQSATPLASARARYLGLITPRFHEALARAVPAVSELPKLASILGRWCGDVGLAPALAPAVRELLRASCASPEIHEDAVARSTAALTAGARRFKELRNRSRDALIAVDASPQSPTAQADALHALEDSRAAATALVDEAQKLAPLADALANDAAILREAIQSPSLLPAGVEVPLATYPHAGNALLEIEVRPVGILAAGASAASSDTTIITYRFEVAESHYVDVELGLAITGGVPQIPSLSTSNSQAVVIGKDVDQFAALALVELEPARILWPDAPLAGIFRFPVIGIPLSRDPSQNFFLGAGLGWTGIGSITGGPYLLREATLNMGGYPQNLPMGASLTSVTHPKVEVGYYFSASVDLVGLFRLLVPRHLGTFDAATGKEQ